MPMDNEGATEAILNNRYQGDRESTYAMLMHLLINGMMPECLRTLERMVIERIGCWRDVCGFIRHFEAQYEPLVHAAIAFEVIQGCVRMTNAQLRKDCLNHSHTHNNGSLAAKWVPREPKCRGSTLMMWYYEALAADMFPRAPDAKRRYRKLISSLTPLASAHSLSWFVKQAERVQDQERVQEINALWLKRVANAPPTPFTQSGVVPVLSLAHSMGPGHNNCLHAGIGVALHVAALSSQRHILTFSSHAEWHALESDFVSQAQQLLRAARSPMNGLNANLTAAAAAAATNGNETLLVIGDMEHDEPTNVNQRMMTWNVSRNGRPATVCGYRHQLINNISKY